MSANEHDDDQPDREDVIERLRAENERLREALKPFAKISGVHWVDIEHGNGFSCWIEGTWVTAARAAISGEIRAEPQKSQEKMG